MVSGGGAPTAHHHCSPPPLTIFRTGVQVRHMLGVQRSFEAADPGLHARRGRLGPPSIRLGGWFNVDLCMNLVQGTQADTTVEQASLTTFVGPVLLPEPSNPCLCRAELTLLSGLTPEERSHELPTSPESQAMLTLAGTQYQSKHGQPIPSHIQSSLIMAMKAAETPLPRFLCTPGMVRRHTDTMDATVSEELPSEWLTSLNVSMSTIPLAVGSGMLATTIDDDRQSTLAISATAANQHNGRWPHYSTPTWAKLPAEGQPPLFSAGKLTSWHTQPTRCAHWCTEQAVRCVHRRWTAR